MSEGDIDKVTTVLEELSSSSSSSSSNSAIDKKYEIYDEFEDILRIANATGQQGMNPDDTPSVDVTGTCVVM